MTTTKQPLKIGISVGDINGIGLEVALKTLSDKRLLQWCTPILYGSTKVVSYHKNIAKIRDISLHSATDIQSVNPNAVNVINCWMENVKITLGKCTPEGGKYATFSLEQATADLKAGHLDALVTAPIHKKAMQDSGFTFPGHTEYLTNKFQAPLNLMLLVNESLRVGLVTNHLPIQQVAETITQALVLEKIRLMDKTLRMDFGVDRPAIAVLGLNPHAGDEGVLGNEEIEHIIPAIEQAKAEGILAIGPYAADGFFGSANYANFDGILAMYHDQGLVPFKALSFGKGINFTAGLPIIRTSPDHGTGFDIAGKNVANHQSFREALYLALDSARQRAEYLATQRERPKADASATKETHASKEDKRKKNGSNKNHRDAQDRSKSNKNNERSKQKEPQKQAESSTPTKEPTTEVPQQEASKKQLTVEERLALAAEKRAKEADQKQEKATEEMPLVPVENAAPEEQGPIQPIAPTEEAVASEEVIANEEAVTNEEPKDPAQ